jgi:pimeloyl-ACP methyl ester carboxylesterase
MKVRVGLLLVASLAASMGVARAAEVALPPFYEGVMAMTPEGKLGAVIAREAVATSLPNAEAWRIAYVSSDVLERPTISTALVIAPTGDIPAEGRPIISWAHGTTGTAQNCGPSQEWDPAQTLNEYFLVGGTSGTDFGVPAADQFLAKGYVLVATDYQGLGGGGKHQYAVSATQARDAINAIRAVGSLGLSGASRKAAVYGWSQGGGAVLAAASLGDYIARDGSAFDGIDLVGFAAMAPQDVAVLAPQGALDDAAAAKFLAGIESAFTDNVFNFAHFAMTIWATAAAFPELELTDIFTEDGAKTLDTIFSKKCMHPGSDTINFAYGANFKSLLAPTPKNQLAWAKSLIAGSVPPARPVAPVVIYWGTADTVVAPSMGQLYREQMCAMAGADVTRVQLAGAQSHFTTPGAAEPLYVPWIADRLAGNPLANGCDAP